MSIDGKKLEISAPIADYEQLWQTGSKTCFATLGGEMLGCSLGPITGPSGGPYSIFSGVHLSGGEIEQSALNDPSSWQNWRNLFLGHTPEEKLTRFFNYWAIVSFVVLYAAIPLFIGYFRTGFAVNQPSGRMIIISLAGLAIVLLIINSYFGLPLVSTVLLRMIIVGVVLGAVAVATFWVKKDEIDLKMLGANLAIRLIHVTAMVPFIYAFALIMMVMLGYDD